MSRLQQAIARWTLRRQGHDLGEFRLDRRRLYIVPTGFGFAYATMLLAMLVGGLNYGNNLALLLAFVLAAAGWVAMHQAHANLQGLVGTLSGTLSATLSGTVAGTAQTAATDGPVDFHLTLRTTDGEPRWDLEVDGPARGGLETPPVVSVAAGQTTHLHWTQPASTGLRRVRLATRYPLGLFRAWTWLHPATVAAPAAAVTPATRAGDAGEVPTSPSAAGDGDIISLRPWREGEGWQRIAWRASARLGRRVVLERTWLAPRAASEPAPRLRAPPPDLVTTDLEPRTLRPALLALGTASTLLWGQLPWVVSALLAAALLWRWLVSQRHWSLPPRWLKLLLALAGALGVLLAFRTWNGLAAGSALLATMAALKLTETRDRRDLGVLFFLAAFLTYAAVLANGTPATALLALGALWLALAALVARARPPGSTGEVPLLKPIGRLLLYGLPITLLLFLFVPRIDGHFWALPANGKAQSGLGDEMRPGDISELSLSDDPVMRVFFADRLPPRAQRYWRGPVLHDFDGGTWRAARGTPYPTSATALQGPAVVYRVLLEPSQHRYLPLLERAAAWDLSGAQQGWDLTVQAERPVTSLLAYRATSYAAATVATHELPLSLRRRALQWPTGTNPKTRAWAVELRALHRDDAALLGAVLQRFSEPPFTYTLTPTQLENTNAVDEFLFSTREGFCGHYASALAAVARAAGIPARVVTGYQGGEWNRMGRYLLVRQADAHAWVEAWLPGRGWVRVDPTAAVAPERVEQGLDSALGADEPVPGRWSQRWAWLGEARTLLDAARTHWQQRFLQFDRAAQERLAAALGFGADGLTSLVRALVALLAVAGAVLFWMVAQGGNWRLAPRAVRIWRRACRRAEKAGVVRERGEGEMTYAERVARVCPPLAAEIRTAAAAYTAWRYLPEE